MVASDEAIVVHSCADGRPLATMARFERLVTPTLGMAESRVVFDPGGLTLTCFGTIAGGDALGTWDARTGELLTSRSGVDFGPVLASYDGCVVMATVASGGQRIVLWDLATGTQRRSFVTEQIVDACAVAAGGRALLNGTRAGSVASSWSLGPRPVELWDLERGVMLDSREGRRSSTDVAEDWTRSDVEAIAISPDGVRGLFGRPSWFDSPNVSLELVTLASFEVERCITRRTTDQDGAAAPRAVTFSPDGRFLAAVGDALGVLVGSVVEPRTCNDTSIRDRGPCAVAFDDGGSRLVTGEEDGTVRLWSVEDGELPRTK